MLVSILFWCLAAICNAIMDTLVHHYYQSIFFRLNKYFWNPEESWLHAKRINILRYKIDAWHVFKSLMIIFQALSIMFAWMSGPPLLDIWWYYLIFITILGICWNVIFTIFYDIVLIR